MDARVPRKEDQQTFFLEKKQNKEENLRAQREDQMLTRAMGGPLAEQVNANAWSGYFLVLRPKSVIFPLRVRKK